MLEKIYFVLLIATCLASKSPVLIWSSIRGLSDLPQSYTGQTIDSDEFHKSYLKPLSTKNNLVVFIQDRLSLQDLNQHADVYNPYSDGGAFRNIKSFMEDQFSVQIPSVKSPWTGLEKMMKDFDGKTHEVMDLADLGNLNLGENSNLIIVSLSPVQGSADDGKVFAENDAKMSEVTKHLIKRGVQFTAVYTGQTAAKSSEVQSGVSRRLQAANDFMCENCTFVNVTCKERRGVPLFFYMRSMKVFAETNSKTLNRTTTIVYLVDNGTTCDNDTATLRLRTQSAVDGLSLSLEWIILKDNFTDFWNITNSSISFDWMINGSIQIRASDEPVDIKIVLAPKDFSYHCSAFEVSQTNGTTANITLTFDGFQLQPFNVMDGQFSDGWDCIVFFSPGIWMAIFSLSVMIIIILFGLTMIAAVKSMDKYDDPKGKTITVNVSE